jgi:hypothetical protein
MPDEIFHPIIFFYRGFGMKIDMRPSGASFPSV